MMTEAIIKFIFNQKFARYGRMLKLNIHTKSKSFTIEVHPKGETSPIHITIGSYEILTGEKGGIKLNDISTTGIDSRVVHAKFCG